MPDYALLDVYANDLHVIYPCDESIHTIRKNYMPGVPEGKIFYDGASWKTGEDVRGQGVWSFPEKYAGEIARAIMYVACIYPADLWVGPGLCLWMPENILRCQNQLSDTCLLLTTVMLLRKEN